MKDAVSHPPHYLAHPSGVECIQITEHMNFCLGNAIKYIWRCEEKGSKVENLEKAIWYLKREIARVQGSGVQEGDGQALGGDVGGGGGPVLSGYLDGDGSGGVLGR